MTTYTRAVSLPADALFAVFRLASTGLRRIEFPALISPLLVLAGALATFLFYFLFVLVAAPALFLKDDKLGITFDEGSACGELVASLLGSLLAVAGFWVLPSTLLVGLF